MVTRLDSQLDSFGAGGTGSNLRDALDPGYLLAAVADDMGFLWAPRSLCATTFYRMTYLCQLNLYASGISHSMHCYKKFVTRK